MPFDPFALPPWPGPLGRCALLTANAEPVIPSFYPTYGVQGTGEENPVASVLLSTLPGLLYRCSAVFTKNSRPGFLFCQPSRARELHGLDTKEHNLGDTDDKI